ncbi:MAG: hypothetical protein LUE89_04675 [Clostridiales bacterium]|nr:hypothetical protein [Clostridiales bacterium]
MKKKLKKLLSLCLIAATFAAMLVVPANAASSTIRCYTISSGNTTAYSSASLKTKSGTIYASDELYVVATSSSYPNSIKVSYPTSSGRKTGWISKSKIVLSSTGKTKWATKKITTYRRNSTAKTYGSISKYDKVTVLGTKGSYTQVKYPISGGYKFAWIKTTDANKYLSTSVIIVL